MMVSPQDTNVLRLPNSSRPRAQGPEPREEFQSPVNGSSAQPHMVSGAPLQYLPSRGVAGSLGKRLHDRPPRRCNPQARSPKHPQHMRSTGFL